MYRLFYRRRTLLAAVVGGLLSASLISSCTGSEQTKAGSPSGSVSTAADNAVNATLHVGAIPDQDPEELQRLYSVLADYLSQELDVPVMYKPVTDYAAAVTAFKVGDLDLVWFGALTGVQARLQVPEAAAIAQRNIDEEFHSIFIASSTSDLSPITAPSELAQLKDKSITFGSESSTSGRLMPQYFLSEAGVNLADFKGEPGFSGSHDATIKLVEAGTYDVGAINEQVWIDRVADGEIDESKVSAIWQTPAYYNYHWVANTESVNKKFGADFTQKIQTALLELDPEIPEEAEILGLFGAEEFIETENDNYNQIESVGREIGKISD